MVGLVQAKEYSRQCFRGILTGVAGCGLATLVDHACRKYFQVQPPSSVNSRKFGQAVIAEVIYSVFLQPDKGLMSRWGWYSVTALRAFSAWSTGAAAARAICHLTNYSAGANGGLSLEQKVGLLWMVCREGLLRLLPARLAACSLGLANNLVFGLAELCPSNGQQLPDLNVVKHKLCTAIAFRLIAQLGTQYGNLLSPFVQHTLFNYKIFWESK
jgi:hypothetical protein